MEGMPPYSWRHTLRPWCPPCKQIDHDDASFNPSLIEHAALFRGKAEALHDPDDLPHIGSTTNWVRAAGRLIR